MSRRVKGEGSMYQRGDGRWVGVVDLGWVGGKRVRRSVTARTLRELRPKFRELQRRLEGGVTEEDMTVEAWFTRWLDTIAARRVRPRTLDTYRGYVRTWVVPHLGRFRLEKLRPEHIEAMYDAMRDAGRSDATRRQVHAIVKKALKDAVLRGHLLRSPADVAQAPPVGKGRHPHLEPDDAKRVLAAARSDARTLARVTVAILLGLRQSEALGLLWTDLHGGMLAVERAVQRHKGAGLVETDLKSDASHRVIPVPAAVAAVLEAWRDESGGAGYIFGHDGQPADPRQDYEDWRAACIRGGVTPVPLHGARASTITLLLEMGVPVHVASAIVGHADPSVTLRHYARSDAGQMSRALDQLDRMLDT